jgi:predicted dehydrogenase
MTINIGIVGASFAKAAYLPAIKNIPDANVIAISSFRMESAKSCAEEFSVPNFYDNWEKMLNSHNFDLVCIATPTDLHAPITLMSLEKGAHILTEKPTAMNSIEAKQMLDTAIKYKKIHMIDHELRFNPNRKKIKKWISSNEIGNIRHINISNISNGWADPSSRPKNDWWSLNEKGGGRLGANGSHQVDLIRWWCGEVKSVFGQALTIIKDRIDKRSGESWKATADDLSYFSLEMQNAALVNIFMSGVASNAIGNKTQIFGSEGSIILSDTDEEIWLAKPKEKFQKFYFKDDNESVEGLNKGIWNVSVFSLMKELISAIKEKRDIVEGSTFEDGYKNQIVLDAVKESTTKRQWIDL